jgi:hypothetical protein
MEREYLFEQQSKLPRKLQTVVLSYSHHLKDQLGAFSVVNAHPVGNGGAWKYCLRCIISIQTDSEVIIISTQDA